MATAKKEVFTAIIEGQQRKLALMRPNREIGQKAQMAYNRALRDAVKSGAMFRAKLEAEAREQGIWSDEREVEYKALVDRVNECERKLAAGGIRLTEARELGIEMRQKRAEMRDMLSERTQLDVNSAEGQAENARFNTLVAECLVYNDTGKRVFDGLEDYLSRSTEEYAFEAASRLGAMMYGLDSNYEANLPENKFLSEWGFIDDKLRLVNKDGHLISVDGHLIDENGRYVDADGNFVDREGNLLTDEGAYKVESQPFLDDNDEPIVKPSDSAKEETNEEEQPKADDAPQ